ncbi:hypothetical protein HEB94_006857 [Actinopolymorpha pittospori]|uniref:Uncharacterized protein n=1 Tax=Actinopolymorpha pittospori TaxID=648752 RepID=A0A927RCK8_9ACTN|nr:hypothetical protein [Actinopolymorpha pittospori]
MRSSGLSVPTKSDATDMHDPDTQRRAAMVSTFFL